MKTYKVTETYIVTRTLSVLAPDPEAAKAWDVHPKAFVLDCGENRRSDYTFTAEEEK